MINDGNNVGVRQKCDNCLYSKEVSHMIGSMRFCRRYPPTKHPVHGNTSNFIMVQGFDWCGEWKPK